MTLTDNFWPNLLAGVAAGVVFLLLTAIAFGAEVPKLDVASACRAASSADIGIKYDSDRCLQSENDARKELASKWTTFPAADRALCTQTATMGGTASYVELITCLEMKQAVAKLPSDPVLDMRTRPSGLRQKPRP